MICTEPAVDGLQVRFTRGLRATVVTLELRVIGAIALKTCEVVPVALPSLTVSVTLYVPTAAYVCDGVWPLPVVPSPKVQDQLAIEVPSGSLEPLPSKPQARPVQPPVNLAVGGVFGGGAG